jgi:hypothetical protein
MPRPIFSFVKLPNGDWIACARLHTRYGWTAAAVLVPNEAIGMARAKLGKLYELEHRALPASVSGDDEIGSFGSWIKGAAGNALRASLKAGLALKVAGQLVQQARAGVSTAQAAILRIKDEAAKNPLAAKALQLVKIAGSLPGHVYEMGKHIAAGERVDVAALGTLRAAVKDAKDSLPLAKIAVSMVPGIGTGAAAALAAAEVLSEGGTMTEAGIAAARASLPGGGLARAAFEAGVTLGKGGRLDDAGFNALRSALPKGALTDAALTTGAALGKAAVSKAGGARPGVGPAAAQAASALVASRKPLALAARRVMVPARPKLAPARAIAVRRVLLAHAPASPLARKLLASPQFAPQLPPRLAPRLTAHITAWI